MSRYSVPWEMYGESVVEADSPEEAERIVVRECMDWRGGLATARCWVNGASTGDAEEAEL